MPRRIVVMRHAKSSWKSAGQSDHERPLNGRGRRDAPRVGAYLADAGWAPDLVLSSDSARTQETWALAGEAFAEPDVEFTRELYLAGPREVADLVARVSPRVETLLLLGHNEGWEDVVAWLCGRDVRLTTANAALLSCEAETWPDALLQAPGWTLHEVVRPKELD